MNLTIQKLIVKLAKEGRLTVDTNILPDWEFLETSGSTHTAFDHQLMQDSLGQKINEIIDMINNGEVREIVGTDGIFITEQDDKIVIGLQDFVQDADDDTKYYKMSDLKFAAEGDNTFISKTAVDKLISEAIIGATTIQGTVLVGLVAGIDSNINFFNSGSFITLSDGTTYSRAEASPGDVIIFAQDPFNASEIVDTEQALVDNSLRMTLITNNNVSNGRITANEIKNGDQDISINGIYLLLDAKVGGTNGAMDSSYTPTLNNHVATNRQISELSQRIIDNSGTGLYDTNTTLTARANTLDTRMTDVEDAINGGIDFDVADAKITWSGTVAGTGSATVATFQLPTTANGLSSGKDFDYSPLQTIEIGLTDSIATSTISVTIDRIDPENIYLKDDEIGCTLVVDSTGLMTVTRVHGNDNISNELSLTKVNQITTFASASFAKNEDLVDLENEVLSLLSKKQDSDDAALNTTNKTVVGGINENKIVIDQNSTRIDLANSNIDINSNYNSIFDINVNNKLSIGLTEDSMFKELLAEYESGRLTIGSAVAMQMRNNNTLQNAVEICHDAEVKEINFDGGVGARYFVIAVDKHVDSNETYTKGMVTIIEGITDEATYSQQDVYAFVGDNIVIDVTDISTYQGIYQAHGTRFNTGDYIRMQSGVDSTYTTGTIVVHVGAKYTPAGSPPGADQFTIEGKLYSEDGFNSKEVYLHIPSTSANIGIIIDAWDDVVDQKYRISSENIVGSEYESDEYAAGNGFFNIEIMEHNVPSNILASNTAYGAIMITNTSGRDMVFESFSASFYVEYQIDRNDFGIAYNRVGNGMTINGGITQGISVGASFFTSNGSYGRTHCTVISRGFKLPAGHQILTGPSRYSGLNQEFLGSQNQINGIFKFVD